MAFPDEFHNRAVPVGDRKDLVLHQEFPLIFPLILPVGSQSQIQFARGDFPLQKENLIIPFSNFTIAARTVMMKPQERMVQQ